MGSEVSGMTAVVGDRKKEFRNMGNDEVEKLLKEAMSQVEGVTRFYFDLDKPAVCLVDFETPEKLNIFVNKQEDHKGFEPFWANKNMGEMQRIVQRTLGKIKRGICEVARVEGTKVRILCAPVNKVILNKDGTAIEVANVDDFEIIHWDNAVEP